MTNIQKHQHRSDERNRPKGSAGTSPEPKACRNQNPRPQSSTNATRCSLSCGQTTRAPYSAEARPPKWGVLGYIDICCKAFRILHIRESTKLEVISSAGCLFSVFHLCSASCPHLKQSLWLPDNQFICKPWQVQSKVNQLLINLRYALRHTEQARKGKRSLHSPNMQSALSLTDANGKVI